MLGVRDCNNTAKQVMIVSYIIAFVKFPESNTSYPVDCLRTDLKTGDDVWIRRRDGKMRSAIVTSLKYLNWNCSARIECKVSEAPLDEQGYIALPKGTPFTIGVATADEFVVHLRQRGWIPLKPRSKTFRSVLVHTNETESARIFIRKNGIDLQVVPGKKETKPKPFSLFEGSFNDGRLVRHTLAHTTFNLFEGLLRFSDSFLKNEGGYDRFFKPVGSGDKRTEELKSKSEEKKRERRDELMDIYHASSDGSGGPAYLSDGVWITSSGRLHDWGR